LGSGSRIVFGIFHPNDDHRVESYARFSLKHYLVGIDWPHAVYYSGSSRASSARIPRFP
jgi:hypothetical protein